MQRKSIVLTTISSLTLAIAGSIPAMAADEAVQPEIEVTLDSQTHDVVLQAGSLSQAARNLETESSGFMFPPTGYSADDMERGSLAQTARSLVTESPGFMFPPTGYTAFMEDIIAAGGIPALAEQEVPSIVAGVPLETVVRTQSLSQVVRNTESVAQPENLAVIDQQ